ncbi:hypothetical protein QM012_000163 [Aureobasidium pullulans]|uniref:F-box domain-containing protein n=1 Tax=Aureobasidium pullulans TaxID=5580 RepID=A0ABR0TWJ2_AURPU
MYRKIKLLYWPEQTFDFLGLPPEIRINVYRYILPANGIYYLCARKMRIYGHFPHEIEDEIVHPPPALLCVCRIVYQELWPMIYKTCLFYITIYSIKDLLYALHLIEKFATMITFRSTDLVSCMRNIRIRVNNLMFNIRSLRGDAGEKLIAELSQTTQLWFGPGASLLQDQAQVARLVKRSQGHECVLPHFDAEGLKSFLMFLLNRSDLDKRALIKMLPWCQRRQSRHKSSTSHV